MDKRLCSLVKQYSTDFIKRIYSKLYENSESFIQNIWTSKLIFCYDSAFEKLGKCENYKYVITFSDNIRPKRKSEYEEKDKNKCSNSIDHQSFRFLNDFNVSKCFEDYQIIDINHSQQKVELVFQSPMNNPSALLDHLQNFIMIVNKMDLNKTEPYTDSLQRQNSQTELIESKCTKNESINNPEIKKKFIELTSKEKNNSKDGLTKTKENFMHLLNLQLPQVQVTPIEVPLYRNEPIDSLVQTVFKDSLIMAKENQQILFYLIFYQTVLQLHTSLKDWKILCDSIRQDSDNVILLPDSKNMTLFSSNDNKFNLDSKYFPNASNYARESINENNKENINENNRENMNENNREKSDNVFKSLLLSVQYARQIINDMKDLPLYSKIRRTGICLLDASEKINIKKLENEKSSDNSINKDMTHTSNNNQPKNNQDKVSPITDTFRNKLIVAKKPLEAFSTKKPFKRDDKLFKKSDFRITPTFSPYTGKNKKQNKSASTKKRVSIKSVSQQNNYSFKTSSLKDTFFREPYKHETTNTNEQISNKKELKLANEEEVAAKTILEKDVKTTSNDIMKEGTKSAYNIYSDTKSKKKVKLKKVTGRYPYFSFDSSQLNEKGIVDYVASTKQKNSHSFQPSSHEEKSNSNVLNETAGTSIQERTEFKNDKVEFEDNSKRFFRHTPVTSITPCRFSERNMGSPISGSTEAKFYNYFKDRSHTG